MYPLRHALALSLITALFIGSTHCAAAPTVGPPPQQVEVEYVPNPPGIEVEVWTRNLEVPWSLVFLPGGPHALVSERPGRILLLEKGQPRQRPYADLTEHVRHVAGGEGGLMGLALHPQFPDEPFVYAMHTYTDGGNSAANRVVRLRHDAQALTGAVDRVLIDGIPGSRNHNGGRIGIGPDGMLYVATGDTFRSAIAQDMDSLGGKILRLTLEGRVPSDNPFPGSPIYSLGHRNVQGLAWHPDTGQLYQSEHGPSGEFGLRNMDILNVIHAGRNYGWPNVWGKVEDEEYVDPIVMWPGASVPPGGIAFHKGDLFVATMRSEALVRVVLEPVADAPTANIRAIEHWFAESPNSGRYGRLRDVVTGPDGAVYVLTSNRDNRGRRFEEHDLILRITR